MLRNRLNNERISVLIILISNHLKCETGVHTMIITRDIYNGTYTKEENALLLVCEHTLKLRLAAFVHKAKKWVTNTDTEARNGYYHPDHADPHNTILSYIQYHKPAPFPCDPDTRPQKHVLLS